MAPQSIKPHSNLEMCRLPASLASSQASAESLWVGLALGNTALTSQVTSTQAGSLPCPLLGDPTCSGAFAASAEFAPGLIRLQRCFPCCLAEAVSGGYVAACDTGDPTRLDGDAVVLGGLSEQPVLPCWVPLGGHVAAVAMPPLSAAAGALC